MGVRREPTGLSTHTSGLPKLGLEAARAYALPGPPLRNQVSIDQVPHSSAVGPTQRSELIENSPSSQHFEGELEESNEKPSHQGVLSQFMPHSSLSRTDFSETCEAARLQPMNSYCVYLFH